MKNCFWVRAGIGDPDHSGIALPAVSSSVMASSYQMARLNTPGSLTATVTSTRTARSISSLRPGTVVSGLFKWLGFLPELPKA